MESAPIADEAATSDADPIPDEQLTDADVSTPSESTAKPATPAAVEVEIQHRFNEFERRFNERQQKLLDAQASYIDRWLFVVAIVLTFFSIAIPIAAFIASVFGFKKFEEFKIQAQRYLEEIERNRDKSDEIIQGMNAETAADDPTKAKQVVEDIRENPQASSTDKAIAEAVYLQELGSIEEAIKIWRGIADTFEAVNRDLAARAHFSVGYLLFQQKKPEDAIASYDQAIRLKPDFAEAYNNRGIARVVLGDPEAAIADYGQAIRLRPDLAEAYFNRGNTQGVLDRHEAAIADYDQAIHLKPDYAKAYNNRGLAQSELERHEAAIADYDQAVRLEPNDAEAYNNRGVARDALSRHEAAIADYDQAIHLKPNDAGIYNNRGIAKAALDLIDRAREDFEKACDLARKVGDTSLVSSIEQRLQDLDNREGE